MTNLFLTTTTSAGNIVWIILLVVMIVMMLVLPSISRKKQIAAYNEMQSRLKAGNKVQTVGGIVGRIVRIKESNGVKTIFIETGDKNNKTVIEFDSNAIAGVVEGVEPNITESETQTSADLEAEVIAEEEMNVGFDEEPEVKEEAKQEPTPKKKSSKSKK